MSKTTPRYLSRELSWLEFNRRVLEAAENASHPLLERLKFLAITGSNLDEFFMVRVGGLQLLLTDGKPVLDPAGLSIDEQLDEISRRVGDLVARQMEGLQALDIALAEKGIRRRRIDQLDPAQTSYIEQLFTHELFPLLTPLAVSDTDEFPAIPGLSLALAVRLFPRNDGHSRKPRWAILAIPRGINRIVNLPDGQDFHYILVEDVVRTYIDRLFPGERIAETALFRITRNADMAVREDLAGDLLFQMRKVLQKRKESACVRLELESSASPAMIRFLAGALDVKPRDYYSIAGPLALDGFMALTLLPQFESLRHPVWEPQQTPLLRPGESMFTAISRQDILLYHPYESFDPVVRLLTEAASDPDVLAIKQILYRTSRHSPIIAALVRAAEKGKQVTAIVELKARFDEARNIEGARALERAGAQVIYGIKGLKTHAKLCLIMRREPTGIRRYMHFGTGNYNEITARLYTDVTYMTCHEDFAADASQFFNTITGYSQPLRYRKIEAAPLGLRPRLLELIEGEIVRAQQGLPARIMAKLNSLVDPALIDALYRASAAGVAVRLNVRGICGLRAGVKGLSDHIEVISIVDRFLEHGRILYVHRNGEPQVFISSADWMPRNLDRRIELLVPVEEPACRDYLIRILDTGWADTASSWTLLPDGRFEKRSPGSSSAVRSQEVFFREACQRALRANHDRQQTFQPHRPSPL